MKNGEFTKGDLLVDPDMEVDLENGTVTAYLETWFDVDEKFGIHTADEDHTWVNLYASYTPGTGTFQMEYVISREDSEEWREYNPTNSEKLLVLSMMEECCQTCHGCSLEGYLQDTNGPTQTM